MEYSSTDEICLMELDAYKALRPAKKFNETSNRLLDMAYSDDGKGLIVSAEDIILIYNLNDGSKAKPIECKKYGVNQLEYLTAETCIHSDTTGGIIRLLNMRQKSYEKYYHGHTQKIRALKSNPKERERFMSSADDGDLRMFDTRTHANYGLVHTVHPALIAFDPEGICFAVATKSQTIRLFDVRSFDLGPFKEFKITKNDDDEWTNIEFTPCGRFILVSTNASGVKWIDAFNGSLVHNFSEHKNPNNLPLRATVTPDSEYLIVGSADRNIYGYSTESGNLAFKLQTPFHEPAHIVGFNQKQFMLATLGREVMLWAPEQEYTGERE